ncbi:hypothetical protein ACFWJ4_37545 [Kitasatospora sp. NPDC127067]|uniref:hypothetical protein n=1 Tax=Kitasatospora sp. NPDC127067 TaxID=3347126 RepID=UPI00366012D9
MKLVRRIAATGCALPLALGGLVAVAPTASANSQGCSRHVLEKAPNADKELVEDACQAGAAGGEDAFRTCYHLLRVDYVPATVAADACRRAPNS